MGKSLKFIKRGIIKSDLFGQPLRIYLDKNHKYKSIFGGFLSLGLIIFIFILAYKKFIALYFKTSLKVFENNEYLSDPGLLDLNNKGFMFAFGFQNEYIKQYRDSLLEFKVYYNYQKRNIIKKTLERKVVEINTEFCTEKHFPNNKDEFDQIKLNNYLCPSSNENLTIHGGFHNENFKFLKISIRRCNSTKNKCISDEKLKELFSKSNLYFEFYIINNDIEIQNHESPIKQYIKSDIHFLINPLTNLYKTTDIFLSELEIIDKYNPFALSKDIKNISTYIFKEEKREQTNLLSKPSNTIADFHFRKSYYKYSFTKTYGDAFSILAYLGGLSKAFVIIIGYFASKYNNHSYLLKMSNFLFSFPDDTKKNKKEEENERDNEKEIIEENINKFDNENDDNNVDEKDLNPLVEEEKNLNFRRIKTKDLQKDDRLKKKHSTFTMTSYLLQKVTSYLDSLKPLKPSFKDICAFFPFSKKYKIRKEKIKKAKKATREHLNLGSILLKMQELERLKKILLTDEQNKVFSFFPKPNIFHNDEKNISNDSLIIKNYSAKKLDNYHTFAELFDFVSDLQNSEESNIFKKEINEKLVNLILDEVVEDIKHNLLNENRRMSTLMNSLAENFSPKKKSVSNKRSQFNVNVDEKIYDDENNKEKGNEKEKEKSIIFEIEENNL